jgi:hypothetical protein
MPLLLLLKTSLVYTFTVSVIKLSENELKSWCTLKNTTGQIGAVGRIQNYRQKRQKSKKHVSFRNSSAYCNGATTDGSTAATDGNTATTPRTDGNTAATTDGSTAATDGNTAATTPRTDDTAASGSEE